MWLLDIADALDRDHMFAVDAGERGETGVDARMIDPLGGRIILGDDDCASAASSLSTATDGEARLVMGPVQGGNSWSAQLGPCQTNPPEILEQRNLGIDII